MTAAPAWASVERYDVFCAFCVEGVPEVRVRGKASCGKCLEAMREAGVANNVIVLNLVRSPNVSDRQLIMVIRYVLGLGPRDYVKPLWERALEMRKVR